MSKTLLLADDSVTIQKVVGISFANEDVTLVTVDNGDEAIAKARELRPDVVLADVVMPGKNGYELCEAIKSDPELSHIPVLLLSGAFEAFDEERAQRAGAAGHVAKPFEAQVLVVEVKRLLAQSPPPAPEPTAELEPEFGEAQAGESFDFFDDELGAPSAEEQARSPLEEPSVESFDLEDPDAAFEFGDESASLPDAMPIAEPAGADELERPPSLPVAERTIAILPEKGPEEDASPLSPVEPLIDESDLTVLSAPPEEAPATDPAFEAGDTAPEPLAPLAPAEDEVFDFDLDRDPEPEEDDSLLRVDSDDLAQETVLDPQGASGYDVSSSDLGDPLAAGLEPITDPFRLPEPEMPREALEPPGFELVEPEPEAVAEQTPAIMVEPAPEADADLDPFSRPEAIPVPSAGGRPAAPVDAVLSEITPQLREQIHDTLEKIAWESFGDVAEKIVRQALERVEAIAWEVIPQMAEAVIREEIRRMKGEIED